MTVANLIAVLSQYDQNAVVNVGTVGRIIISGYKDGNGNIILNVVG